MATNASGKKSKRMRPKSKSPIDDDEPFCIKDNSDASDDHPTKTIMDQYVQSYYGADNKTKKKKKKENVDALALASLKKGKGIRKDTDDTNISANLYDPDDVKSKKSNKRTESEQNAKSNERIVDGHKLGTQKLAKKSKPKCALEEKENDKPISPTLSTDRKPSPRKLKTKSMDADAVSTTAKSQTDAQSAKTVTGEQTERSPTKQRKVKRKKKKNQDDAAADPGISATGEEEQPPASTVGPAAEPTPEITDDGFVAGLIVHRTDKLKTDFFMCHPLVRVHVVDAKTGDNLKKQHRERAVTSFYEAQNDSVDFIMPMMTQPFDFKKKMSILPVWEDLLLFNENFNYFIQDEPQVMLFFELLDFVTMNRASRQYNRVKGDSGWHRIAWAFLKVVGANGELNTGKKLRLQLYYPPLGSRPTKPGTLEVYHWWKNKYLHAYPSTLYVTLKATKPTGMIQPSGRSMFATQQEQGHRAFEMMQLNSEQTGMKREENDKRRPAAWSRLAGQVCKIPNKLCVSLPAGGKGCFVVEFSHDGRYLACGCHDKDGYPIIIYEIPSGRLHGQLLGHYSIIYDLCWSRNDKTLVSASADCTARVWNIETMSSMPMKTVPHPSFIYAAKFHVRIDKLLVTGGYDHIIRLWSLHGDDSHARLVQELEGHENFVNSLCFDSEGKKMYSADSSGCVIVWNVHVTDKPSKKGVLQDWTVNRKIQDKDIEGIAISCIKMHPISERLLVQSKDNTLRHVDLRVNCVMQKFVGALNFRERIRCDFSPCGSFVFSGSEDRCVYVWNSETGDQVAVYTDLSFQSAVCDVAYHPHDHMAAFCAFGDNHPVLVYKYDRQVAQEDAGITCEALTVKVTGRPGSPNVKAGANLLDVPETAQALVADTREEFNANETARYQKVMRKLDSVSGWGSANLAPSPERSLPVGESMRYTTDQNMLSWGSTFDSTVAMPYRSLTPDAGLMSPTEYRETAARQQQFAAQTRYMQQSETGWRPTFHTVGRQGSLRKSGAQIACTMSSGKPEFTFESSHVNSANQIKVVALYDYAAQRSDELSLQYGDTITVLYKDNANWWMGELANGQQGFFPANYVTGVNDAEEIEDAEKTQDDVHKLTADKTHTTAVLTHSGKLSFISAAEDSDANEVRTPTRRKKATESPSKKVRASKGSKSPKARRRLETTLIVHDETGTSPKRTSRRHCKSPGQKQL